LGVDVNQVIGYTIRELGTDLTISKQRIKKMIFIKCFTTPISKMPQVNVTRGTSTKCHNPTKTSLGRLSDLIMTCQMLGGCDIAPNYDEVGWTATLDEKALS
jgi:hypothetical protein